MEDISNKSSVVNSSYLCTIYSVILNYISDMDTHLQRDSGQIRFLYTNMDSLLRKRDILKVEIENEKPHIIIIIEVLPKNQTTCDIEYYAE